MAEALFFPRPLPTPLFGVEGVVVDDDDVRGEVEVDMEVCVVEVEGDGVVEVEGDCVVKVEADDADDVESKADGVDVVVVEAESFPPLWGVTGTLKTPESLDLRCITFFNAIGLSTLES